MSTQQRRCVAVTGAGGFVGSWLRRAFREKAESAGFDVVPLLSGRGPDGHPGDIRDADGVTAAIAAIRPMAVVHLAAIAAPATARADPRAAWEVNVMGTLNLARAVLSEAPGARFIFASSSEVYGGSFLASADPLDESAPLAPRNAYASTKAAADLMLGQMALDGLNCLRLRPFNHTGPGQTEDYVVPAFARQIAEIEAGLRPPVLKVGNLDAKRDFLDVRDVVGAYVNAATDPCAIESGTVLNLSTGRPVSIRAITDILLAQAKVPIDVETDPERVRPNDVPIASGRPDKARERLGWEARIPLERTLADVLDFWRAQREAVTVRK